MKRICTGAVYTGLLVSALVLSVACVSEPAPTPPVQTPATATATTPAQPATPVQASTQTQAEPDIAKLIASGDAAGLRALFKGREQANQVGADGLYPLHSAVQKKSGEMVEILLAMGAVPDPLDKDGKTPLRYAVEQSDEASAKALVAKGASVFLADKAGVSPLDAAIAKRFTAALVDRNVVARSGKDGRTPLHIAVDRLSMEAVRIILDLNPDLSSKDGAARTPLDAAFMHPGSKEAAAIAEVLVSRNAPSTLDNFSYFVRAVRDTNYARARFSDGATVLHEAVRFDHRGFLTFFLERGVPVEARNASGATALHDAVKLGRMDAAGILLKAGADPNARDGAGDTPLRMALASEGAEKSARFLLDAGADPSIKDKSGNTSLHVAVELGYPAAFLELLLAEGAPVDAANAAGDTALAIAMRRRNAPSAAVLAGRGASMFVRNVAGETPLSIALSDGAEATGILIGASSKDARDDSGDSPYHHAVRLDAAPGTIEVMKKLGVDPSARNNEGDTALMVAVRRGAQAQGSAMLEAGSDPFTANAAGASPVVMALNAKGGPLDWFFTPAVMEGKDASGNGPLHYAAMAGLADGIAYLAEKGAEIDARNADGRTPLMLALRKDSTGTVKALLSLGADATARDSAGSTALHLAVYWNAGNCLQLLASSVADLDPRDYTGKTPLRDAIDRSDAAATAFLLETGASPLARDNTGETPLHAAARQADERYARALVLKVRTPDVRDDSGATPLIESVYAENAAAARVLAGVGASIHARDAAGESPLSYALKRGGSVLSALLDKTTAVSSDSQGRSVLRVIIDTKPIVEYVDMALSSGALPDDRDSTGLSPLHVAALQGYDDIVVRLVNAGADLFVKDAEGATPAGIALAKGESAIRAMFGNAPDRSDYLGETALHYAAAAGLDAAVSSLLALGADPSAVNAAGETPADVAKRRGHEALSTLLSTGK